MYDLSVALLFLLLLVGCFWGGQAARRFLREAHRSRELVDSIRVVITLLVTFAALVLGLLISSSQTRFSTFQAGMRGLSRNITELDARLREIRAGGRSAARRPDLYTKAAIADTWRGEPAPQGNYPRHLNPLVEGGMESLELGAILRRIDLAIRRLEPDDAFHRSIAASLQIRMTELLQQRRDLLENGEPSLSWPFLAILMFWLAVIFVIAGLSSPRNAVMVLVTTLAALSLASSIFLALELDRPLNGFINVSSGPLRDALLHITQPLLPEGAP